ncbi:Superfamily II DNA and RNA helicase [Friedmanniella luteola]|uniref:RNA helicase n=2 Tax=Friedmanniella luteola TaxID=546871 RepID=A0A1H1VR86_9ACTN|nr:DEAD/DEAH box helicase [Friedmanniella luteola]SDS87407.1 Superfamily II DNA and RNA helicase [Friedmanniella luteola]
MAAEELPTPLPQTFRDLGVVDPIADALDAVGISHPFPIQAMAIPIALTGTDMIGQARTGTGKTLAFGIPLLQRVVVREDRDFEAQAKPGAPQALVVTPTRELASQVSKDLAVAATQRKARVVTLYGGMGYEPQLDALTAGVEVVVGTPGRLLDLADRRALDLSHIKVLVLDEADEMLDLGFLPDVERILAKTPELRQTMLFSATMPAAIVTLARRHLRHPVNIRAESAEDSTTVPATAQFVYQAHDLDKPEVVARILQAENRNRVMIFCRTKRSAQRVSDDLAERGFNATSIHGDLSQVLREKALKRFRGGESDVLVATDVAARGIDVTDVTHVINYECPDDDKTYVHRIGRTGRAGASGIAITFVDWADRTRWKVINNTLGLPFEEPQETYSTSEHLFHDLGIDPAAKGRIVEPKAEEHVAGPSWEERRTQRKSAPRERRRTRHGATDGDATAASPTPISEPVVHQPTDESGPAESGSGDAPRRRRRRRRSGSAAGAGTAS